MEIKSAKELLREMEISFCPFPEHSGEEYLVDTDEDHVINFAIKYATQFIELAAKEASTPRYGVSIPKEILLKLKEQIK